MQKTYTDDAGVVWSVAETDTEIVYTRVSPLPSAPQARVAWRHVVPKAPGAGPTVTEGDLTPHETAMLVSLYQGRPNYRTEPGMLLRLYPDSTPRERERVIAVYRAHEAGQR